MRRPECIFQGGRGTECMNVFCKGMKAKKIKKIKKKEEGSNVQIK